MFGWMSKKEKAIKEGFARAKEDHDKLWKRVNSVEDGLADTNLRINSVGEKYDLLRSEFSELTNASVSPVRSEIKEVQENAVVVDVLGGLTPQVKKAFGLITMLLNELGGEWLPKSDLTSEIYGMKATAASKNNVSNILRKLKDRNLVRDMRRGKFGFISLTKEGLTLAKQIAPNSVSRIELS